MLEKPDIQDESIIVCLQGEYGLNVVRLVFLPLEADLNTAVYRVITDDDLKSNFLPNGTIEIAYRSDRALSPEHCRRS